MPELLKKGNRSEKNIVEKQIMHMTVRVGGKILICVLLPYKRVSTEQNKRLYAFLLFKMYKKYLI